MDNYADELSDILKVLKETPRGMSVSDIADKIGVNRNTVSRYLDILRISGQVDMKTYGKAKVFFISQRAPLSAMLNFSSDMVAIIDSDLCVVQVNDALCRLLKVNRDEIVGKELRNSPLVGFDHPIINERMKSALDGEETVDEIKIFRDLEERYYKIKIIPTVLNDSSPGVTIMLEDTTEEKRATEALLESERNFRSLVEEINDTILDINDAGDLLYASPKIKEITGLSADETVGNSLFKYMDPVCGERFKAAMQSARQNNGSELIECNFSVNRDGGQGGERQIKMELSITPKFDEIGMLNGYRVVGRDISARDRAVKGLFKWKSFLNSIVDNIPSMVVVKEVGNGTYVHFNSAAEKFFGIVGENSIGKMGFELFPDKVTEFFAAGDRSIAADKVPVFMPELTLKVNGSEHVLKVRKVPIFGIDNALEYILTILEDITEEKRSQEALVSQRDEAQSYLDVAGVMIAVINTDGTIRRLNRTGCEMLGYGEEEIIGADWFMTVVPKDRAKELKRRFEEAVSGKISINPSAEGVVVRKDGKETGVIWQNTFLKNSKGETVAMVTSASPKN
ncbi:MAG: PAS domain S-box protein [Methanomicrobium sp.]|nr:PAS domain S-box protein [Methanomicrobium sp.]